MPLSSNPFHYTSLQASITCHSSPFHLASDLHSIPHHFSLHSIPYCFQAKARDQGLWNLFLPLESDPDGQYGGGLTNLEYAHLAEIMGQSVFASEV